MKTNSLHEEENFWPSISDMFLSFFVIALALAAFYHNTNDRDGMSLDKAFKEHADTMLANLEMEEEYNTNAETDRANRPMLADLLCRAADHIRSKDGKRLKTKWWLGIPNKPEGCNGDYELALNYLGKGLGLTWQQKETSPYEKLVFISEKVRELSRGEKDKLTYDELEKLLAHKERVIAQKDTEIKHLNNTINDLVSHAGKEKALLEELANTKKELAKAKSELALAKEEVLQLKEEMKRMEEKHKGIIAGYVEIINKITNAKDVRPHLMDVIWEKLLHSDIPLSNDGVNGITIDKANGIIRIPSSQVSFGSGKRVPKEKEGKELLEKLAVFLAQVAKANNTEKHEWGIYNMVDNIVIECHCDAKPFEYSYEDWDWELDGNEVLSSERSLIVWDIMNRKSKLSSYVNQRGQGLFSHAGFGSRVLMTPHEDEARLLKPNAHEAIRRIKNGHLKLSRSDMDTIERYLERCRRIDIRFNCTPAVEHQNE